MPEQEMSFWAHLDALRSVIMKIGAVMLVLAVGYFAAMPWIFDHVITAPCTGSFALYRLFGFLRGDGTWLPDLSDRDFRVDLINIELASQFMVHMSASFWAAFVTGFPIVVYLLWTFVEPGLYEKEKRGARRAFVCGNALFYLGTLAGYFLVFPLALRFLADYQLSDKIATTVSLTSYMDTFYMILLMMGLLFELPLVAWMLGRAGVLKRSVFSRYRRHAAVGILVLSAILTPTGDIFTLFVTFFPVYMLWEASAFLVPKDQQEQV